MVSRRTPVDTIMLSLDPMLPGLQKIIVCLEALNSAVL